MTTRASTRSLASWTYRDLADLPADLVMREIWQGRLTMLPLTSKQHQTVVSNVLEALVAFDPDGDRGEYLPGPIDVVLAENVVLQPDVLWVWTEHKQIMTPQRINGAPDLCVEVASPFTLYADQTIKRHLYLKHGAREYWLIDPEARTLAVHTPGHEGGYTVYEAGTFARSTLKQLAGMEVAVSKLFAAAG